MVDYYTLAGFHCDEVPARSLRYEASATARATRSVKDAVRIAREVATGRARGGRSIPVALKPVASKPPEKPYSTI